MCTQFRSVNRRSLDRAQHSPGSRARTASSPGIRFATSGPWPTLFPKNTHHIRLHETHRLPLLRPLDAIAAVAGGTSRPERSWTRFGLGRPAPRRSSRRSASRLRCAQQRNNPARDGALGGSETGTALDNGAGEYSFAVGGSVGHGRECSAGILRTRALRIAAPDWRV